ncbi:MAG: DUF389 domain-containing protein [Chloroflexota bacterium]|nr:DUF389 domain-containing protein [Chloroflexota bacterium]
MSLRNRLLEIRWTLGREWFGVWEVRDYYTTLEQLAKTGAEITFGYILMVLVSAALATGGLLLNSPAVVIGSMCVAPFLGPSRAVCIGGLFRERRVFWSGLVKQLVGLLVIGAGLAYVMTVLLQASVPGIEVTPEILLRAMSTPRDAVLSVLIAVSAGIAASLALSADPHIVETPWDQFIDAMIGVEIAISLIPPASVVGIGLAFGRLDISRNAFLLLLVNVLGLDIFGSMLTLFLRGVRAQYLAQEKAIRRAAEYTLAAIPGTSPVGSTIHVTLLSHAAAKVHAAVRNQEGEVIPANVAQNIAAEVKDSTGYRSEVTVEIIPFQTYSTL